MAKKKKKKAKAPDLKSGPVTQREERHILYLLEQGTKIRDIMRISRRGYRAVAEIAKAHGIDLSAQKSRGRSEPTDEQKAQILELGGKGLGYAKIARLLGLSEKVVRAHLQKEGIFVGRGGLLTPAIQAEPAFPESDDFHLSPAERARLEYIRQLKKAKWEHLHPDTHGKENDHDSD